MDEARVLHDFLAWCSQYNKTHHSEDAAPMGILAYWVREYQNR